MKGILFVVDCLRTDAFPDWFLKKHSGTLYRRFLCCFNTTASLSSLLAGCHLYATAKSPVNDVDSKAGGTFMYHMQPCIPSIPQRLEKLKIRTLFQTDERYLEKGWWRDHVIKKHPEGDNYFLLWHTYEAHSPHGKYPHHFTGRLAERAKCKQAYLGQVESAFRKVDSIIKKLKPDKFAVTGDHGEEFWVNGYAGDGRKRKTGHGSFGNPIVTANTMFVPLFLSGGKGVVDHYVSYPFLADRIVEWYR